jgi:Flp pilus assembly protein TadG
VKAKIAIVSVPNKTAGGLPLRASFIVSRARNRSFQNRSSSGAIAAEFAATIALMVPIVCAILFCCYEVAMAFTIYNALNHSAHLAAMALSKAYGSDAGYATSSSMQQNVLKSVTFPNIVADPQQFTVAFPPAPATASWKGQTGDVPLVVVTCTYQGGKYGLARFPNPDLLNLGSRFPLQAKATAYLEGF